MRSKVEGFIVTGDPTKNGDVVLTIKCQDEDGAIETIELTVPILATDDENEKADKIEDAIAAQNSLCFTANSFGNEITLTPNDEDGKIVKIGVTSSTSETIGSKCTVSAVQGDGSFSGNSLGGLASFSVEPVFVSTDTTDKTTTEIMEELTALLSIEGIGAIFEINKIIITDNLVNTELELGTSDLGLDVHTNLVCGVAFIDGELLPIDTTALLLAGAVQATVSTANYSAELGWTSVPLPRVAGEDVHDCPYLTL